MIVASADNVDGGDVPHTSGWQETVAGRVRQSCAAVATSVASRSGCTDETRGSGGGAVSRPQTQRPTLPPVWFSESVRVLHPQVHFDALQQQQVLCLPERADVASTECGAKCEATSTSMVARLFAIMSTTGNIGWPDPAA